VNLALAIAAGLLLIVVQPRLSLWIFAPFAIAPLLLAAAREWRPKARFLLGYAAGALFWAGTCYWIHFVMSVHGKLGPWLGGFAFVLFCAIKGLHLAIFTTLAGVLIHRRYALAAIPALWVIIERIPDPFGFMWLQLGNAGIGMGVPLRLAPLVGVYGLSFVFAMMGAAVALLILKRPREQFLPVLVLPVMLVLPALPAPQEGNEAAVAVQPNTPEVDEWTYPMVERMNRMLDYLSLRPSLIPGKARPQLILWPEVPAPIYYEEDPGLRDRLTRIARLTGAHILLGTVAYTDDKAPLNSAILVGPDGRTIGRYDKMFLVPFGEYIPFPFGGLVSKITSEIGDFVPGRKVVTFRTGGERIGVFICYESAFPHLVRSFAAEGATVLANLSNDGYFGGSAAREQHLSLVRMRAAENRRWILRATNDGITAAIDPGGRVIETFPEFTETSGRLRFSYVHETTPYTRYGDWFAWLCGAGALAGLVLSQWPNYKPESQRPARQRRGERQDASS
jgi:apolipoprotein N-acyltransferase